MFDISTGSICPRRGRIGEAGQDRHHSLLHVAFCHRLIPQHSEKHIDNSDLLHSCFNILCLGGPFISY